MAKRILVVPDVHGETFWKEPVSRYIEDVDKIIFLGDYLDPYNDGGKEYSPQGVFDNLMDIVDLKRRHMDKVILLKGNHDQHYASNTFRNLACGSRCDMTNWNVFHIVFNTFKDLFKLIHFEEIKEIPFLFSHAGLTLYWINKVNSKIWKLADNKISVANPDIVDRINLLDISEEGQEMLAVVGKYRSSFGGAKSGSVLWADIEEHDIPDAPKAYDLNKVFQVVGHSRLNGEYDKVEFDNLVLIDSQQCFIIDEDHKERIVTVDEYEKN